MSCEVGEKGGRITASKSKTKAFAFNGILPKPLDRVAGEAEQEGECEAPDCDDNGQSNDDIGNLGAFLEQAEILYE